MGMDADSVLFSAFPAHLPDWLNNEWYHNWLGDVSFALRRLW